MHVARINPDLPGYQIFNVFEGAKAAPYGFALRDALTGKYSLVNMQKKILDAA